MALLFSNSSFLLVVLCLFWNGFLCDYSQDTQVQYVHLALTDDPTSIVVGWYTEDKTKSSLVHYGTTPSKNGIPSDYPFVTNGTWNIWKEGYGVNHFTVLKGLKPQTTYFYICGDDLGGYSSQYNFTTAPEALVPFSVGIYGDMGVEFMENTLKQVTKRAQQRDFSWIFHIGDLGYADDHVLSFHKTWNKFFAQIDPFTSTIPYMVGPGNHEYTSYDPALFRSTRNFVVFNSRFMMPHATNQSKNMFYSFDYSYVHFISYSTESSFPDAPYGEINDFGDQLLWLEADLKLANINRKRTPWIIVMGHRPIYSSSVGYSENGVPINSISPPSNSATLQKVFEDLFVKYKVDVVFNGHVHSYERNFPAYKSKRTGDYMNPTSPLNIVVGCAGNLERLENENEKDWTPQPEWSAHRFGTDYGYGILDVQNGTHLHWKFYRATDDGLEDEVVIINKNH